MSEEKATTEPTIIFSQNEVLSPVVPPKSRPYRKYVIAAVIGVVVAAIVLTAILVGMYLFTEGQKDILKFSYTRDGNVKEEVTSDPNTNIVQYHVTDPAYEMWVVNDFNRDIQVMKIKAESGTNCYVAPLNRTMATDPSKVSAPSNIKATLKTQNATYTVKYSVSNSPIPDTSFLSKAAKDTCQGISAYWVYPSCEIPKYPSESPSRKKRGGSCCINVWGVSYCWPC